MAGPDYHISGLTRGAHHPDGGFPFIYALFRASGDLLWGRDGAVNSPLWTTVQSNAVQNIPKISIITPSLNQGAYIERTIKSVLSQNYPNLEYIVVDGGSTDNTLDILQRYGIRLTWLSERDEGQSDAINKGIRMSTGDILAFLNSDDLYEPHALKHVSDFFMKNPSVLWLTGRCMIIDENDHEIRKPITKYKNFLLDHYSYTMLLITNPISQPATFWRREVIEEFGLFDAREHFTMDYEYWLRIGRKYSPAILHEYLASFRVYRESKTSSSFLKTFRQELNLAKRYTGSKVIHALHHMNYWGICSMYMLFHIISRIRQRFA